MSLVARVPDFINHTQGTNNQSKVVISSYTPSYTLADGQVVCTKDLTVTNNSGVVQYRQQEFFCRATANFSTGDGHAIFSLPAAAADTDYLITINAGMPGKAASGFSAIVQVSYVQSTGVFTESVTECGVSTEFPTGALDMTDAGVLRLDAFTDEVNEVVANITVVTVGPGTA